VVIVSLYIILTKGKKEQKVQEEMGEDKLVTLPNELSSRPAKKL
jgi:hypothetical protein